jgi:hypothetical protein
MRLLGFAYRFLVNFAFLALVYLSLNYVEKYNNRAVLAILILIYSGMRAASALRTFHFFQRVERLELETRRLISTREEGPNSLASRKQVILDVVRLRREGEVSSYIDLFFLAAVVLLCVSKIFTN